MQRKTNLLPYVSYAIILVGIILRIIVYLQNRSLIIDEANLARNIVEKDSLAFFKPLNYEQYSPPLFSILSKINTQLWGINEYALKLFPLLGGIFSLILLLILCRILIEQYPARWYVLFLFSFSFLNVRYSTEFKQYSLDVALVLLFILWTLKIKDRDFDLGLVIKLTLAGMVAVWLSMPIIFILAAMGVLFLYQSFKFKNIKLIPLLFMGGCWLFSFGLYYFSILHADATSDYLQNFHRAYFFNLFPTSLATFKHNIALLREFFYSISDKTFLSLAFVVINFVVGIFYLIKHKRTEILLLLLPIIFCLIASHLGKYSLIPRVSLFLLPLIILIIGIGISCLWNKSNRYFKGLLVIIMLISCINKKAHKIFLKKMEMEDSKGAMTYLKDHRNQDELIYVHHSGAPAFQFYNQMHDNSWHFKNYHIATWDEIPEASMPSLLNAESNKASKEEYYLFFSHTYPPAEIEKVIKSSEKIATKTADYKSVEALVQKYKMK